MAHQAPPGSPELKLTSLDASSHPAPAGDYDALTDLFLGPATESASAGLQREAARRIGRDGRANSKASPTARSCIEGLILGHLPVMAAAWGMQYARELAAQRQEPIGMLKLRDDEVSVEVVGGEPLEPVSDLAEALEAAVSQARHWLVRIDGDREALLARHGRLDSVTLLSGADQAATVAAYGTIKALFGEGADAARGGEAEPAVKIVIVGSADGRTMQTREALARAATAFLSREVAIMAGPHRIGAAGMPTVHLYSGESPQLNDLLAMLRDCLSSSEPRSVGRGELDRHLVRMMEEAVSASAQREESKTVQAQEAERNGGLLSDHLGLISLVPRCPYAPGVELAADGEGRLHLLASTGASGGPAGGDGPLRGLLTAAAWASNHAELLQLAAPALQQPPTNATLHLFVDDARAVRHLCETGVRLHLLAPVTVGGESGWFCSALN